MADPALNLTSLRSPSLRERVLQQLRRLIDDGTFEAGAQLPSERTLSDRLQVSRGTVREAVQLLAALGVVETRHGHGTFVRGTAGAGAIREEWAQWTVRHSGHIRELLEVRRGLESFAAELAALRRGRGQLAALEQALEDTADASEPVDIPARVQADMAFHQAIYESAGNPTLAGLLEAIGAQLVRERATTWNIAGRSQRSYEQHREILDGIAAGDPARASAAVIAHLRSIEEELAQLTRPGSDPAPPAPHTPPHRQKEER